MITKAVLHSSVYQEIFDNLFQSLTTNNRRKMFLKDTQTTSSLFIQTLIAEELAQSSCSPEQASIEGERQLRLLNRLYKILDENTGYHYQAITLAVSTGTWIAEKKGNIRELELIVSGLAIFAHQVVGRQELEYLYELSLKIMRATDKHHKLDLDKSNSNRPWRLLCINHCIIATRTGNSEMARLAYDRLIQYLPEEASSFFDQGMQMAHSGQLSLNCSQVLCTYYQMYGTNQQFTRGLGVSLN